ncbi:CoA-binding protein [Noviherbaspirillum sedimenti]|uniref:CoA-binding protein n=2 Tax=Noviherbaspirillum sedimenti TaxID=2320865 RepID=A0A3A3G6P9_9BURK|nr:CoA-binding protein [Noviherbaspirillum sedimenti]
MTNDPARHALETFLNPRSVALVGATDRSGWSRSTFCNLQDWGFGGRVHLVNKKGGQVHGRIATASCVGVDAAIDVALLMVPAAVIPDALDDIAEAGIANAIILASGFSESGAQGQARQAALMAHAKARKIRLLGPNTLGFLNVRKRAPVWTSRLPAPLLPGHVGIISQSGAMGGYIGKLAHQQGVGLSYLVATGNECDVDVALVLDYLVSDPHTKVVAMFIETIRDTAAFLAAVERARDAGKPLVILKVGTSELAVKAAQAHTGALIGDDKVFDSVCRDRGLIRVPSLEDMVITAGMLASTGRIKNQRLGVISISGGAGEIVADRAALEEVEIVTFSAETCARLGEIRPEFSACHNPFDITGAAILEPELFAHTIPIVAADPGVGMLAVVLDVPTTTDDYNPIVVKALEHIGNALRATEVPALVVNMITKPVTPMTREIAAKAELPFIIGGLNQTLFAIGRAFWWSSWIERHERQAATDAAGPAAASVRPHSEREALAYLDSQGVSVIPSFLAESQDAAVRAAAQINCAVALKIASPDIAHKSDVGGVRLNVSGAAAVADGFRRIMADVGNAVPAARLDGVLVSPMRSGGIELFVGVTRDPQWGPVIAVGLGGIWVEALKDSSLRLLPITPEVALDMLKELRGAKLLQGYRGARPADLVALGRTIAGIANAALALGPELLAFEVNPLRVEGDCVEALDALAVWRDTAGQEH